MSLKPPFYVKKKGRYTVYILSFSLSVASALTLYLLLGFSYTFRLYLDLALTLSMLPAAVTQILEAKRTRSVDDNLQRLLADLADAQQSGLSLVNALKEASKREYGLLTSDVRYMVSRMEWGFTLEEALRGFTGRAATPLASRVVTLILEAVRYGGDLKTVFSNTAGFVKRVNELRRERDRRLRPYVLVVYVTIILLLAVTVILFKSFIEAISVAGGVPGLPFFTPLSRVQLKTAMLDLASIEAGFGGFVAGKIAEGFLKAGVKHSATLLLLVFLTFYFFM